MDINILSRNNSILNRFMNELRNVDIQNDSMRFRRNLERIGEIMAYEISKTFDYQETEIQTPLSGHTTTLPKNQIVVGAILRAALPLHNGFVNYLDNAENAFISAYRVEHNDGSLDFKVEYCASPDLTNKTFILVDPMLATGKSMAKCYDLFLSKGIPAKTHFVAVIGSEKGLEHLKNHVPENASIWLAEVDAELNDKSYIVPGLGDAGDLAFGEKL